MRNLARNCAVFLSMLALLAGVSWTFGLTPEGLLDHHWPANDDHPTNWYDTALHPEAR